MENKIILNKSFYDNQWLHSWKQKFMYDPIFKSKVALFLLKKSDYQDGNKNILDIGFGSGVLLFKFSRSNQIVGVEVSESAILNATKKAKTLGFEKFGFYPYTSEGSLPLQNNSQDLVICSHVLEHVPDDDYLLDEIFRVLRYSGIALLNIPINEEHYLDPRHVRKYLPDKFVFQLKSHNFKIQQECYADRLWNLFGWFFENNYHKKIPVIGFIISAAINIIFSLIPFRLQYLIESTLFTKVKPRQFVVCVKKY